MKNAGNKRVVIIGAGIAGLSAGCYARMNGYEAEIFEAHARPGGFCTSWQRKGYTIDGCIHWLIGSAPGNSFYPIWEELGALQGRRIYDREVFERFVGMDGREVFLYTDASRLEQHLKELSHQDAAEVEKMCAMIGKFGRFSMPHDKPPELMRKVDGLRAVARMRPYLKDLMALGGLPLGQYATRFRDPLIRESIRMSMSDENLPVLILLLNLGPMNEKCAGYPLGGSLEFARGIERRYRELGGKITYQTRVEKLLEREGKTAGVRLDSGSEVQADYVISAADMNWTLRSLLEKRSADPVHEELFATQPVFDPCVQVSFGVNMDLQAECDGYQYTQLAVPLELAGRKHAWFNYRNYSFDPSLAPSGKSVVAVHLPTDWEYWQALARNRAAYRAEKDRIAETCAGQLERPYPGFRSKIEMTDVATPLTYARYTGSWKGTFMTWNLTGTFRKTHRYIPKTVPGLENFWMAGMWTNPPGGLPGAALAGREVIQLICHREKRRFQTTTGTRDRAAA
jgi:phytoene dehydrogenase-like protein